MSVSVLDLFDPGVAFTIIPLMLKHRHRQSQDGQRNTQTQAADCQKTVRLVIGYGSTFSNLRSKRVIIRSWRKDDFAFCLLWPSTFLTSAVW